MGKVGVDYMIQCAGCKNTDETKFMGCQYSLDDPEHYDGVSEWHCCVCGVRTGRWSGKRLNPGQSEKRFDRN